MKTRFDILLLAMLTVFVMTATCVNSTYAQLGSWPTAFSADTGFYGEVSAKFLDRPGADLGLTLVSDELTNQTLFSSDEITDVGSAAGAEVRFGNRTRNGRQWEIRTSVVNWDNQFLIEGANLVSPLFPGFSPDSINTDYESKLFSIELSFRRAVYPGITLFAGPRFVSLREDLDFSTSAVFPPPGAFELDTNNTIETRNSFFGFQVGSDLNMPVTRQMFLNGFIRVGGYSNPINFRSSAATSFTPSADTEFSETTESFIGEVGGRVVTDIVPGVVSSYIGYEATWIDGVALAPAQLSTVDTGQIITDNTPFFHGITFGIGFRR